jgi:hypothetical protein
MFVGCTQKLLFIKLKMTQISICKDLMILDIN